MLPRSPARPGPALLDPPESAEQAPLCLVGMSGVGKSFWSQRLASLGFVRHDCDGAIAARLSELVVPAAGEPLARAMGRWMGMPWSPGHAGREARYLELEEQVTAEALAACDAPGRHVIDSTGSVIYLSPPLLAALRARCRVVYLRTSDERREAMLRRFLDEPKPVVWGGAFTAAAGQPPEQALPGCYARLLALRDQRYQALAHATLDGGELELRSPGAGEFLALCGPHPPGLAGLGRRRRAVVSTPPCARCSSPSRRPACSGLRPPPRSPRRPTTTRCCWATTRAAARGPTASGGAPRS